MRSSRNKSLGRCKRLKGSLLGVMRGTIGGISAPEAMISSKTQKLSNCPVEKKKKRPWPATSFLFQNREGVLVGLRYKVRTVEWQMFTLTTP